MAYNINTQTPTPGQIPWHPQAILLFNLTKEIGEHLNLASTGFDFIDDKIFDIDQKIADLTNEVGAARQSEPDLLGAFGLYVKLSGMTSDLNAGGYKITNSADGTDPQDLTSLSQVTAMIIGGGSPGDISILALNTAGLEAGQNIKASSDGTAVAGEAMIGVSGTYQSLPGDRIVITASTAFTVTLPQNPVQNITTVRFLAFLDDIETNNITIAPFGAQLIDGLNESVIISSDIPVEFIFVDGLIGWKKISQQKINSIYDPLGFALWHKAVTKPSVYNILPLLNS